MNVKQYIDILKEIKETSKKEKLQITDEMAIAIMQEIGKDSRTPNYEKKDDNKPTQKQLDLMKNLKIEIPEKLEESLKG